MKIEGFESCVKSNVSGLSNFMKMINLHSSMAQNVHEIRGLKKGNHGTRDENSSPVPDIK